MFIFWNITILATHLIFKAFNKVLIATLKTGKI